MERLVRKSLIVTSIITVISFFTACGGGTSSASKSSTGSPSIAVLSSIAVSSTGSGNMNAGDTRQMKATGTYSDNSSKDLTSQVNWASSSNAVASVNSTGMVTANGYGSANITATYYTGVAGGASVSVNASITSVSLSPLSSTLNVAGTMQLTATANYSDNSTRDVTSSATWSTSNSASATVAGGLVTGVAGGSATITGTYSGFNVTATVSVKANGVTLVGLAVSPSNGSVALGDSLQMSAIGTYSDSSTGDVTSQVTWASSDTNLATVSSAGLVTPVAMGGLQITATMGSVVGTASLQVRPQLSSITVLPASPSIQPNTTQQLTASATYSDGSQQDITSQVTWNTSNSSVATIDTTGLATGVASGTATITASLKGVNGTDLLTVSSTPTLTSILVDEDGETVPLGVPVQLTATGVYSDNSTAPLVGVNFTSSDSTIVSVDANGVASTVAVGSVTITATLGSANGTGTLTVGPQTLVSLALTPATLSVPVGLQQQFTATGTFTDSSTQVLTNGVTWTSSDPTVASVDQNGNITAITVGSTTITATVGAISNTAALAVTNATLVSLAITPNTAAMPATVTQQFTATGTYTDATTLDLTSSVTWVSSNGAVATISNSGLALGVTPGTVTVTASSGNVQGTASLTIDNATIVSIAVTPANDSVNKGTRVQYHAVATFSDSSTQDITHLCSWGSSKPSIAHINGAGLARAHKKGTVNIKASYDGVSGTTTLTVN